MAIAAGCRPAKTQPTIRKHRHGNQNDEEITNRDVAKRPDTTIQRAARSQPIMPMQPPNVPRSAPRKPSAPSVTAVSVRVQPPLE
jgi:hypothetical protein